MTTKEVSFILTGKYDSPHVRKNKGAFRYHRSYFYRHSMTPEALTEDVLAKFPHAIIIDKGDHWHSFVGGASSGSSKDSYMWVKFKV